MNWLTVVAKLATFAYNYTFVCVHACTIMFSAWRIQPFLYELSNKTLIQYFSTVQVFFSLYFV